MKTENENLHLQELKQEELISIVAGGEADDLAYNIVYFGLRTNPTFWLVKYNFAVLNAIF